MQTIQTAVISCYYAKQENQCKKFCQTDRDAFGTWVSLLIRCQKKERLFIGVFWAGYCLSCSNVVEQGTPILLLGFSPNSHPFPFYPPNFCLSFTADLMNSCIIIIKDSSPSTILLSCERVVNTISFAKCGTSTFVMILSFLCIFFANYSSHIHL